MDKPKTVSGGCKCGKVTYSGVPFDGPGFKCFCRDCQQLTGTGHAEMFPLGRETIQLDGKTTEFQMTGGSGGKTFNVFCPTCGCPIYRRSERMSDRLYVHAGSLDDPEIHNPEKEIYVDSAQPWDHPSARKPD